MSNSQSARFRSPMGACCHNSATCSTWSRYPSNLVTLGHVTPHMQGVRNAHSPPRGPYNCAQGWSSAVREVRVLPMAACRPNSATCSTPPAPFSLRSGPLIVTGCLLRVRILLSHPKIDNPSPYWVQSTPLSAFDKGPWMSPPAATTPPPSRVMNLYGTYDIGSLT